MIPETGPYLKAAVICDNVIEGKDGVLSLIRVIDRATLTAAGSEVPPEMPPVTRELKLVLMFISGRARGTHSVQFKIEKPDGDIREGWSGTAFFEGEDRGANLVIQINFTFELEGLYWFHVLVGDSPFTRLPFRLIYQRVGPRTAPQ